MNITNSITNRVSESRGAPIASHLGGGKAKFDQLDQIWPTEIYCLFCPNWPNLVQLVNLLGQFDQILAKLVQILDKLWNLIAKLLKVPSIFDKLNSNFWPTRAYFPNIGGGRGAPPHGGTPVRKLPTYTENYYDSLLLIFALKEFNKYAEKRRRLGGEGKADMTNSVRIL